MSKERLSKLQKWILIEDSKNSNLKHLIRADILEFYYGWKSKEIDFMGRPRFDKKIIGLDEYNKKQVILTRALKRLIEKGFLKKDCKSGRKGNTFYNITEEGLTVASFLMLNNSSYGYKLTLREQNKTPPVNPNDSTKGNEEP